MRGAAVDGRVVVRVGAGVWPVGLCVCAAATVAAPHNRRWLWNVGYVQRIGGQKAQLGAAWQVPRLVGGVPLTAGAANRCAVRIGVAVEHDAPVQRNCRVNVGSHLERKKESLECSRITTVRGSYGGRTGVVRMSSAAMLATSSTDRFQDSGLFNFFWHAI